MRSLLSQDSRNEHFLVVPETGIIEGTTAIGRATVQQLQMNTPLLDAIGALSLILAPCLHFPLFIRSDDT